MVHTTATGVGRALVLASLALVAGSSAACMASRLARQRFENEFGCDDATVSDLGAGAYRVRGCGRSATYVCVGWSTGTHGSGGMSCVLESSSSPVGPQGPGGATGEVTARWEEERGATVVQANMDFAGYHLVLVGAPSVEAERALLVLSPRSGGVFSERCPWVRIEAGAGTVEAAPSREDRREDATTLRFDIPVEPLASLPTNANWRIRFCDQNRLLGYNGQRLLLEFTEKFRVTASTTGATAASTTTTDAATGGESGSTTDGNPSPTDPGEPAAGLTADVVRTKLAAQRELIGACYNNALANVPTLAGRLKLVVVVDVLGTVTIEVEEDSPELAAAGVTPCITGILGTLSFTTNPPTGAELRVPLPITFSPP